MPGYGLNNLGVPCLIKKGRDNSVPEDMRGDRFCNPALLCGSLHALINFVPPLQISSPAGKDKTFWVIQLSFS